MLNLHCHSLLGFDFRLPADVPRTVDMLLWEQASEVNQKLIREGYSENFLELLDAPVSVIEAHSKPQAIAVAVAVTPSGLEAIKKNYGWPVMEHNCTVSQLIERNWVFEGFDVAGENGMFSIFEIDYCSPKLPVGKTLFSREADAEALIGPAAKLYPSHAPFIVYSVFTY